MKIPHVEILDKYSRLAVDIVEPSECWFELQYYGCGEFEVYAQANQRNLASLKIGNYVKIPQHPHLWIIEKIEITNDEDRGLMISATGRQAKAILAKRIINTQTQLASDLQTAVLALVNKHIGESAGSSRRISWLLTEQGAVSQSIDETQVSHENLLTFTESLLQTYGCGAEMKLDGTSFKYRVFEGADQTETVIFSQMFDNLLDSKYSIDESNYRNFVLVGGQGEGAERITDSISSETVANPIDRCEAFVDAKDISSKYTDANGQEKELDLTSSAGLATYKLWLRERGKQALAGLTRIEAFDGTIDTTNSLYEFEKDFYLGDRVTVQDSRMGVFITPRVLKYTVNQTADEHSEAVEYGE